MKAIDISNLDGRLEAAQVAAMRAAGIEKVIVGLQYPGTAYPQGVAHQQLLMLIDGGMPHIEVYFESTAPQVAWPNVAQLASRIERAWIAVETGSGFEDNVNLDVALGFADSLGLPKQAGIYTSWYMWSKLMNGVNWYRGRPLWVADYNGAADLNFTSFGGWTSAVMHQYDEHGQVPGVGLEMLLDYCEDEPMAQSKPLTENDIAGIWMKQWSLDHGNAQVPLPAGIRQIDIEALEQAGDGADVYTITIERS